ncbi:shikimate kinase [Anoxynatronum buryatiense]|uniref:Shikimate kinase n=1 Tax=Anoxynatronum buryatiense TaxID=489973 RepID=A0AA45WUR7_9CLOT|nr:shikimate kinase [Anoxynatronum buryatiense]SMP48650.1 shikimate kinase [Anoxynatronum buryatiense]
MTRLEDLRKKVDLCDRQLAAVLEKRLEIIMEIMEEKKLQKMPIFNKEREEKVINQIGHYVANPDLREEVRFIHQHVLQSCRRIQSKRLFPYHITLVGFMGSGKTTVGVELSNMLAMEQIDVDRVIEERMNMRVSEIFQLYGEQVFRQLESNVVEELSKRENVIIFCSGGGVVLNEKNIENIKETGVIVWLKASPQEIYRRICDDQSRPLLKDNMSVDKISQMLESRLPLYEDAADLVVNTDEKDVEQVSHEIVEQLMQLDINRKVHHRHAINL